MVELVSCRSLEISGQFFLHFECQQVNLLVEDCFPTSPSCHFISENFVISNKLSLTVPLLEHHAASGHHLQSFVSLLLDWLPWFHNWGKNCCYIHQNLLLGFSNWPVIYTSSTHPHQVFWCHCRGGRRRLLRGEFSHAHPLLCLLFYFTLFLLASFYQKPKKN
jgi:hypothetical protein